MTTEAELRIEHGAQLQRLASEHENKIRELQIEAEFGMTQAVLGRDAELAALKQEKARLAAQLADMAQIVLERDAELTALKQQNATLAGELAKVTSE